uniref:Uncharacterized protein n=1 Tax=Ciona savignyi TaxID=51511 RepID=H2ZF94_CIOSA
MSENVKIHVSAADSISDQPITISVSGKSMQRVTLHSHTTIDNGNAFECVAVYQADGKGNIDLHQSESLGGNYTGIEPMGLIWGMKPSPANKKPFARFVKLDVTSPLVVRLRVYEESIFTLERLSSGHVGELASTQMNRWFMAKGTKRIPVTVKIDNNFSLNTKTCSPAVVVLFGGFPGTMEYKAALLSSHGFAAFALAFYGEPGLQPSDDLYSNGFDLDYFNKVFDYLSSVPSVDTRRGFGVCCISFSSFIVLTAAACLNRVSCVIWINGFTQAIMMDLKYRGKKFIQYPEKNINFDALTVGEDGVSRLRGYFPWIDDPFAPDAIVGLSDFYRRKNVSYLFIAGLNDENVASEYWANQAEKLLKMANHPSYKILRYPGAGHLIEPPFAPHNAITAQKGQAIIMNWGGEMIPHCRAQEDSWTEQINFLRENLTGNLISKL